MTMAANIASYQHVTREMETDDMSGPIIPHSCGTDELRYAREFSLASKNGGLPITRTIATSSLSIAIQSNSCFVIAINGLLFNGHWPL